MKKVIFFLFTLLVVNHSFSQSVEDEAQALYQKAEDAYENKQYHDCEDNLQKTWKLLASPNPKILYLWIKNTDDALKSGVFSNNLKNNQQQLQLLTTFFQMVDKNNYPHDKYLELVNIKLDVEGKIADCERRKVIYENLKSREALFIKDTVDVYGEAFCNEFNEGLENYLHKIKKSQADFIINKGYGYLPAKIEYNINGLFAPGTSLIHSIIVYYTKDLKRSYLVSLLSPIRIHFADPKIIERTNSYSDTYSYIEMITEANKKNQSLPGRDLFIIGFGNIVPESSDYNFDFSQNISKIQELKNIMDVTGFTDYYNNKFDDVKD